jgi:hypothetical protein
MTTYCLFFSTFFFLHTYNIYNSANRDRAGKKNVSIFAWQKGQQPFFPAFSAGFFMLLGGTAGKPPTQIRQE